MSEPSQQAPCKNVAFTRGPSLQGKEQIYQHPENQSESDGNDEEGPERGAFTSGITSFRGDRKEAILLFYFREIDELQPRGSARKGDPLGSRAEIPAVRTSIVEKFSLPGKTTPGTAHLTEKPAAMGTYLVAGRNFLFTVFTEEPWFHGETPDSYGISVTSNSAK